MCSAHGSHVCCMDRLPHLSLMHINADCCADLKVSQQVQEHGRLQELARQVQVYYALHPCYSLSFTTLLPRSDLFASSLLRLAIGLLGVEVAFKSGYRSNTFYITCTVSTCSMKFLLSFSRFCQVYHVHPFSTLVSSDPPSVRGP